MDNHPGLHQMNATITIRNIKKIRLAPTHEPQDCSDEEADEEERSTENDDWSVKDHVLTSLSTGTPLTPDIVNELRETLLDEVESKLSKKEQVHDLDRLELSATLACCRWEVSRIERCLNYKEFIPELEHEIRQRLRRRHISAGNQVCLCLVDDDDDARIENKGCGHRLHLECWAGMISAQVNDITNEALSPWENQRHAFTCTVPDCGCVLSEEIVANRIVVEEKKEMAKQDLFIRSFKGLRPIQNTAGQLVNTEAYYLQRCPQDGCQEVHVVSEEYPTEIECKGIWYCILCRSPSHAPTSCRGMDLWQQRLAEYMDRQRDLDRILQEERQGREVRNFSLGRDAHRLDLYHRVPPLPVLLPVPLPEEARRQREAQEERRRLREARRRDLQERREEARRRAFGELPQYQPSYPALSSPGQEEPTWVGCFGPGPLVSPCSFNPLPVAPPSSGRGSDELPYRPSAPPYGREPVAQPMEQQRASSSTSNNNNQQAASSSSSSSSTAAASSSSSSSSTAGAHDIGPLELWLSELTEDSQWFEFEPSTTTGAPSAAASSQIGTSTTAKPSSAAPSQIGTVALSSASSAQIGTTPSTAEGSSAAVCEIAASGPVRISTTVEPSPAASEHGRGNPDLVIDLTAVDERDNGYDFLGSATASSSSSISVQSFVPFSSVTETPGPTMQSDETGRGGSAMPLPIDRAWLRANNLETIVRRPADVDAYDSRLSLNPMMGTEAAQTKPTNEAHGGVGNPFNANYRQPSFPMRSTPPTVLELPAALRVSTTATADAPSVTGLRRRPELPPVVPPRPSVMIRTARAYETTLPPVSRTSGIVKPCPGPGCDALIEKIEGCNHVKCNRCKIDFCFACLNVMTTGPKVCCQNVGDGRAAVLNLQRRRLELRMLQTRLTPYRGQYEQHQTERNQDVDLSEAPLIKNNPVAAGGARVLIRAGSFLKWLVVLRWELESSEAVERDALRRPPADDSQRLLRRNLGSELRTLYGTLQERVTELRQALKGFVEKPGVDMEWNIQRVNYPVVDELKVTMDRIDQRMKDAGLKVLRFRVPSVA